MCPDQHSPFKLESANHAHALMKIATPTTTATSRENPGDTGAAIEIGMEALE
jgi:hypothetical protein